MPERCSPAKRPCEHTAVGRSLGEEKEPRYEATPAFVFSDFINCLYIEVSSCLNVFYSFSLGNEAILFELWFALIYGTNWCW